ALPAPTPDPHSFPTRRSSDLVIALELLEDPDQAGGVDRGVDLDVQCLAVEVVDNVEGPEPSSARQGVGHEIRRPDGIGEPRDVRSEEHTSELQSREKLVCRLL